MDINYLNKRINSPFLLKIPYKDDFTIFFNRTNGAILVISKIELDLLLTEGRIDSELYNEIIDSQILDFEEIVLHNQDDNFLVTIELSTICNLKCPYCYQRSFIPRKEISNDILEATFDYIEQVFRKNPNQNYVIIGIIGGEPLIHF